MSVVICLVPKERRSYAQQKVLLICFILCCVCCTVRFMFDPTIFRKEVQYRDLFTASTQANVGSQKLRISLQANQTDFWGREIALVRSEDQLERKFAFLPTGGYKAACKELRAKRISFANVCFSPYPLLEVLLALVISILVLRLLRHRVAFTEKSN